MISDYQFLPELFLRAPFYSYTEYDLALLPQVLQRTTFRNAIRLASPVFYAVLRKKNFEHDQLSDKEKHTLAKYYNRMCYRPTPFGAFASFSLLRWGEGGNVRLAPDEEASLHLLPDQALIASLDKLKRHDPARTGLALNPTLYRLGKEIRFVRSGPDDKGHFTFSLESLEALPFHTLLVEFLSAKNVTGREITAWIRENSGCSAQDAAHYLDFLFDVQVITGPEQGHLIYGTGNTAPHSDLGRSRPANLGLPEKDPLSTLQGEKGAVVSPHYAAIERPWNSGAPEEALQAELLKALGLLGKLSQPNGQSALQQFIADFSARYDLEKVPFLLATDPDAGIAYGGLVPEDPAETPLDGIRFPAVPQAETSLAWQAARRFFLRQWTGPGGTILIRDEDVQALDDMPGTHALPSTLALMFRTTGDQIYIEHTGGATANNLSGRFSVFSADAYRLCLDLAAREQAAQPDILFADLGQQTDTHTDNINRRRQIYPYEIPLNVRSALPEEAQIRPEDLLLSVRDGQLILESARHRRRVIPRLPTAYNFYKSDFGPFRLLCDLQYQGLNAPRSIDLEQLFPGLDFYPRVSYGRCILFAARWKIAAKDLDHLRKVSTSGLGQALRSFREKYALPARVSMGREDQQLIFDLTDPQESAFFISCLPVMGTALIQEYLVPDRGVRAGLQPVAGQFIAYLSHGARIYRPLSDFPQANAQVPRQFVLGSDWLYLKFYCTPRLADQLLAELIAPLLRQFRAELDSWFFIRYRDPGHHLRLRFRLNTAAIGPFLAQIKKNLESSENLNKLQGYQADTYERELERYGAGLITRVEELFFWGSDLILQCFGGGDDADERWSPLRLGLVTLQEMTAVFFPNIDDALNFMEKMSASYIREFGGDSALRLSLDQKYRSVRPQVQQWVEANDSGGRDRELWNSIRLLTVKLQEIHELSRDDTQVRKERLLADLVHMQLNRTFSQKTRQQEMLVYYYVHKYLVSRKARRAKAPLRSDQ